jgi:hypothetical protein
MPRGETDRIKLLIKAAADILEQEYPMTVRQLFYRLVSTEDAEGNPWAVNSMAGYHRIIRVLTIARKTEKRKRNG